MPNRPSKEETEIINDSMKELDLGRIYRYHDKEVDLAIVGLKTDVKKITPTTLLLDKPKEWPQGFLVSTSLLVKSLNNREYPKGTRHVSVFESLKEEESYLVKYYKIQQKDFTYGEYPKSFIHENGMNTLTALPLPGDSGASFIISHDSKPKVAGLCQGVEVDEFKHSSTATIRSLITPLYPYKSWINEVMEKESSN